MKPLVSLVCAGLLAALPLAHAQDKAADKMPKQDQEALKKLAQGDLAEVAGGKMAQDKASSEEVKKFAAKMAEDHGRMLDEKKQMAQSKGVTLPDAPEKKAQAESKKLEKLSGAQFDREYMGHMVKDHTEDLKLVQKTARSAKDPELKAAAQKAEPVIQGHLEMAKQVRDSLNGSASRGSGK